METDCTEVYGKDGLAQDRVGGSIYITTEIQLISPKAIYSLTSVTEGWIPWQVCMK